MFRSRRNLAGQSILITGASSGIGRALAIELATRKTRLLLTARREDLLQTLRAETEQLGSKTVCVAGDISDANVRHSLIEAAQEQFGGLDVLINNAGVGGIGTFASADEARLRRIMEVNFFAPMELLRGSLPLLGKSRDGVIVNIGSVLGHCAVPKKSEYCASKFALHGITDALRMELAGQGIDVLLVSPSTTGSQFFDRAMRSDGDAATNANAMSPEQVARAAVRAIEGRRREVILSLGGKLLVFADRMVPGLMSRILGRFG